MGYMPSVLPLLLRTADKKPISSHTCMHKHIRMRVLCVYVCNIYTCMYVYALYASSSSPAVDECRQKARFEGVKYMDTCVCSHIRKDVKYMDTCVCSHIRKDVKYMDTCVCSHMRKDVVPYRCMRACVSMCMYLCCVCVCVSVHEDDEQAHVGVRTYIHTHTQAC
jgi:hypothetical protein